MIQRVERYDQVVALTGGDPYARWTVDPSLPLDGGARDGAVAWTIRREHYAQAPWLDAIGPPAAVAELVADLLTGQHGLRALTPTPRGITVPHLALPLLEEDLRPPEYGDWNWWWTDTLPPHEPAEREVQLLPVATDPLVRGEVAELLAEASPTASADAAEPTVRTWCGSRDRAGRLVACGADRPMVHGGRVVPHLSSIATHPDARGRGYGGAVTAWLIRYALSVQGSPVATLGMYADNDAARSVYRRLGLHAAHHFTSGNLPPPPRRSPSYA